MAIPSDKIGLVVGTPRSGTSLCMELHEALGLPVSGYDIPKDKLFDKLVESAETQEQINAINSNRATNLAKAQALNTRFIELPGVVLNGLENLTPTVLGDKVDISGTVVKVVANAFVPRVLNGKRLGVDSNLIHRVVVMVRNPRSVSSSQSGLMRGELLDKIGGWASAEWADDPLRYLRDMVSLMSYYHDLPQAIKDKFAFIDYDELVDDKDTNIQKIIDLYGITPTAQQLNTAKALVTPTLRRADDLFNGWTPPFDQYALAADAAYEAVKSQNKSDLVNAQALGEGVMDSLSREGLHYFDKNLGINRSAHLARSVEAEPSLKTDLINKAKRRVLAGYDLRAAKNFQELAETYTLNVPADLGDTVEQNYVMYNGAKMTYERAARMHDQLVAQGKAPLKSIQERAEIANTLGE